MSKLPNHYETLNVASHATQEEIKASYITLCKLFHPDLNPGMGDAAMIEELAAAFNVLGNPKTRQDYDLELITYLTSKKAPKLAVQVQVQQLQKQEELPALPVVDEESVIVQDLKISELLEQKRREREALKNQRGDVSSRIASIVAAVSILGVLGFGIMSSKSMLSRVSMMGLQDILGNSSYVRTQIAPNGVAYPETSAYISGYEIRNNTGKSSVMVNNSKNDNDVYLKLLAHDGSRITAVRHVFIKGKTDFKIENLSAGKYEIQYMDLAAGLAGRSEVFAVNETITDLGVKASNMSVTLQPAVNGVLRVENVSQEAFNSVASL